VADVDHGHCGVCGGQSGGAHVGVAAIPGVPMSIAWCRECLERESAPAFVFEHDWVFVANGDPDALNDWAKLRVTWADGHYVPFLEYVKGIDVAAVWKHYEEALKEAEDDHIRTSDDGD